MTGAQTGHSTLDCPRAIEAIYVDCPRVNEGVWGKPLGVPQSKEPNGPHEASRPRRPLPLAELLPLDVRPDLLRHDRRSDRVAAEHGLERVLAALEADGITAERLLRLRHVPSSSVVVSPRRSVGGITTTWTRAKKQKTPRVGGFPDAGNTPYPYGPNAALSRGRPASPHARTSAAAP